MLIILPKPKEITEYHLLAINLETADEIIVSKNADNNTFGLAVVRYFDAHYSNQSLSHYKLGTFESSETCLAAFQEIVEALNSGQKTFVLDIELQPPLPEPDRKNQRSGIL